MEEEEFAYLSSFRVSVITNPVATLLKAFDERS
jgi:hypothetical protein